MKNNDKNKIAEGLAKLIEVKEKPVAQRTFFWEKQADQPKDWSMRAISLNDIIRFMIFLNFDLPLVQKICREISEKYSMNKKLAYHVFRETEDEFSIRNYVRIDTNQSMDKESHWYNISILGSQDLSKKTLEAQSRLSEVFGLVVKYLDPKDALELSMVSRTVHEKIKPVVIENVLHNYEVTQESRVLLWLSYMP